MRDLLAVASVILLALGLGGAAAYLSSEATPAAFEWAREAPVISTITASFHRPRPTAKAHPGDCKYCEDIAELSATFARRGEAARHHAEALQAAMSETADGQSARTPARVAELNTARQAATRAESAAAILRGWSARCADEDFCRIKPQPLKAAACVSKDDAHTAAALLVAAAVKKTAQKCAAASCPAVDCAKSAALRGDVAAIDASLVSLGGPVRMAPGQTPPSQLAVGASTVESELSRVGDESVYVIKMAPFLLDNKSPAPRAAGMQLPKLAPEMVNQRAVSAAQLASMMVQSATITPASRDLRPEAAWRLRSLAVNLAAFGQEAERMTGTGKAQGRVNWERLAQSLGGSLLDLARIHAMLDRARADAPVPGSGCDASVADAAQHIREALAMLDLCRMRSACGRAPDRRDAYQAATHLNSDDPKAVQSAAAAALDALLPRTGEETAAVSVTDVGTQRVLPVADGGRPKLLDLLRSEGVCRRAQDLREAATVAPGAARNVAQALAPPTTGAAVNAISPQTAVAAAAEAVTNAATPTEVASPFGAQTPGAELAQTMARFVGASPRHKPEQVLAADPAASQVRSVLVPDGTSDGMSFVGGPQQFGAPVDAPPTVAAPSPAQHQAPAQSTPAPHN
ncbi:MAG: hypothetical protein GC190_15705 [Alphaproteobacteria bacterium]|nr:hypothetical protein [Alphaproteobacteria bacterium]